MNGTMNNVNTEHEGNVPGGSVRSVGGDAGSPISESSRESGVSYKRGPRYATWMTDGNGGGFQYSEFKEIIMKDVSETFCTQKRFREYFAMLNEYVVSIDKKVEKHEEEQTNFREAAKSILSKFEDRITAFVKQSIEDMKMEIRNEVKNQVEKKMQGLLGNFQCKCLENNWEVLNKQLEVNQDKIKKLEEKEDKRNSEKVDKVIHELIQATEQNKISVESLAEQHEKCSNKMDKQLGHVKMTIDRELKEVKRCMSLEKDILKDSLSDNVKRILELEYKFSSVNFEEINKRIELLQTNMKENNLQLKNLECELSKFNSIELYNSEKESDGSDESEDAQKRLENNVRECVQQLRIKVNNGTVKGKYRKSTWRNYGKKDNCYGHSRKYNNYWYDSVEKYNCNSREYPRHNYNVLRRRKRQEADVWALRHGCYDIPRSFSDEDVQEITNCIRKLSTVPVDIPAFPGVKTSWTSELNFISSDSYNPIPIYRVLDYNGNITSPAEDPKLSQEFIEKVYKNMILLNSMEQILYECQRQGRISFYMTSFGEEAVAIGSAAGLQPQDLVYPQYREAGFFLWRGYSVDEFINQCFGNCEDEGKGRMMPIHYGSKRYNIVTISSPLTVQLPQAVGAAYSFKLAKIDRCAVTYFGEGAASEGDAHAAFNFAATLQCPVLFVCRNNGYAISTPSSEQYKGDGIAGHGPAYGIHTVRVDGNDIFAVYNATKAARDFMIKEKKPVLLEALTYRIGHHSTSDDSTRYRSVSEINQWKGAIHPVSRLRQYMFNKGWWNEEMEKSWKDNALAQVKKSLERSEKLPKPHWKEMFIDVYDNMPDHIIDQMKSLEDHLKVYGEHYPKDYTGKTTV